MSKKVIVVLVVIVVLGLTALIAYLSTIPGSPSSNLHPEQSKVEAIAWWHHNPYPGETSGTEWQIHMEVKFVKLDANNTYLFDSAVLNPYHGDDPNLEGTCEAHSTFGSGHLFSEGDVVRIHFAELYDNFHLMNGNRIDIVLPFYILDACMH